MPATPGDQEAASEGINSRVKSWELWIICLLMEHAVLVFRFLLMHIHPTEPKWVDDAKDTLQYKIAEMKNDETLLEQVDLLSGTEGEAERVREVFERINVGSMGNDLDVELIGVLLGELGMKDLEQADIINIVRQMDRDINGKITLSEFLEWWMTNHVFRKNKYQLRDPHELFAQVDKDGNGLLDAGEVKTMCEMLGMRHLKARQLGQLMADIDYDNDGVINIDEFTMWWRVRPNYLSAVV